MDTSTKLDIWEHREALSFKKPIAESQETEVIIFHFLNNIDYSWSPLSLNDEAVIQRELRNHNIELKCYKLNSFPTTIQDLKSIAYKSKKKLFFIDNIISFLKSSGKLLFHGLYKVFDDRYKGICVILGLLYFDWDLLGWALLAAYFISNFSVMVIHEGWVHQYIVPKNKYVGYFLDLFFGYVIYSIISKSHWRAHHRRHHVTWQTPNDWDGHTFATNKIFSFVMNINCTLYGDMELLRPAIKQHYAELDSVEKFMDDNWRVISIWTNIILMLLMGIKYYFFFVFLQGWIFIRYIKFAAEYFPHKNKVSIQDELEHEKKYAWLFPLITSTAYHASHHYRAGYLIFGPKIAKYFNVQYYFVKLFYNIKAKVL